MNRLLILGADGYLGYSLLNYAENKGIKVLGLDNFLRRRMVREVGGNSLVPIGHRDRNKIQWCNVIDYESLHKHIEEFKPDTIVHFAEQPSAPYSMMNVDKAVFTQRNNVIGTLNLIYAVKDIDPSIHIIKLGTMGVYGTPDHEITESNGPVAYNPASIYHNSKAFDSINLRKAGEWWDIRVTDLHQGVVYGHIDGTRFDYDSYFGTVINRFLAQALIDMPLTVYGTGGQTRGFININDTMRCIELAAENPPEGYRVFNQITEISSIGNLAKLVSEVTGAKIQNIDNPRKEMEDHKYEVVYEGLKELGLKPRLLKDEIENIWNHLQPHRRRVRKEIILPRTTW